MERSIDVWEERLRAEERRMDDRKSHSVRWNGMNTLERNFMPG